MCGDSTDAASVAILMNGKKADMVFTDPPYNINFKPPRGTHGAIENDNMSHDDFKSWLASVVLCLDNSTKDNSYVFVWSGWSTIDQFAPVLRERFTIQAMPVWVKNNFGIGYYSRPQYEPFFLCLKGKPEKPTTAPSDVWEHAKVHKTIHSCEKPVELVSRIMGAYGKGGNVLDLFLGSGSTLIACEKTGRKCYGMELSPQYVDVIIKRWQDFTGKKAVREDGTGFDAL
jgi:DNA modification methylase